MNLLVSVICRYVWLKLTYPSVTIQISKVLLNYESNKLWLSNKFCYSEGVPKDFTFPVNDIRASIGAGFLYPLAAEVDFNIEYRYN